MLSKSVRNAAILTFLVGAVSLMFELLQVRLLSFFIGKSMDVLAIPIALLGLAIGSMLRHFVLKDDIETVMDKMSVAALPVLAFTLLLFYWVANTVFPQTHVTLATPGTEAAKVAVYGALFIPPYILFGAMLSSVFASAPEKIGTLYFFDLLGAALGCAAAPLFLTWFGIEASFAMLFVGAAGMAWVRTNVDVKAKAAIGAGLVLCLGLVGAGVGFAEKVEPTVLARVFGDLRKAGADEVDVRWNAIARTSLLSRADHKRNRFVIVQDNGLSNVQVTPYTGKVRPDAWDQIGQRSVPWRIGMKPKDILITFAGMGRDMVMMDELAKGEANITGIELNPTVVGWANHPQLKAMKLDEFFGKPNINLLPREGRDFLNTDKGQYDLIFIANNGAVHAGRTGHTRKFLDTREAMEAYLARLSPNGMIMMMNQPIMEKLRSLRAIYEEQGQTGFKDKVYVYGNGSKTLDTLLFKPSGFTSAEQKAIDAAVKDFRLKPMLTPDGRGVDRLKRIMTSPLDTLPATTDDQPFTHKIEWWEFRGLPDADRAYDAPYVSGWAKMFTLVLFTLVAGIVAVVAAALGTPAQRVPWRWVAYLMASGIGYMCIQIPLIAKTELLVGNPLYAVSVNLAVFLVFNALGSRAKESRPDLGPLVLAAGVAIAALWAVGAMSVSVGALLSLPLVVKILAVAVFVGPAAFVMGMFYPWCVSELDRLDHDEAVPMTYGLTTLASVVGSAFAMTAVINLGFSSVIIVGVVLYGVSALPGMRR